MKLYEALVSTIIAYQNCIKTNNEEWEAKHLARVKELLDELPHGSGIDGTWRADLIDTTTDLLILSCEYHHMNESGYYDGWTAFRVKVKASLLHGITVRVIGPFPSKYNDTRDYLGEILDMDLRKEVERGAAKG